MLKDNKNSLKSFQNPINYIYRRIFISKIEKLLESQILTNPRYNLF
jgi:hypothetical protein